MGVWAREALPFPAPVREVGVEELAQEPLAFGGALQLPVDNGPKLSAVGEVAAGLRWTSGRGQVKGVQVEVYTLGVEVRGNAQWLEDLLCYAKPFQAELDPSIHTMNAGAGQSACIDYL